MKNEKNDEREQEEDGLKNKGEERKSRRKKR